MSVGVHIVDGAVRAEAAGSDVRPAGAVLVFDGVVRPIEEGRELAALEYHAYEPMATRELAALGEDVVRKHGLMGLRCVHSRGRVGVGECSMRVTIWSAHRAGALAGMGEFIDRLKKDVPIWKKPVWKQ
jgi:molybdopterin synthase catalytic subunit